MDEEEHLYEDSNATSIFDLSDQRLRDKALARNRTLDVLIEELSFNTSISLMSDKLLTNLVESEVSLTVDINRYACRPYGLFVPYILANVFAFICMTVGIVSFVNDGVHPGKRVQDIIHAAQRPAMLSRRTSLDASLNEKGDIEIRISPV